MNAKREKAEALIYKFFDALDPTKANTAFYKEMFANMSDEQFMKFCKRRYPFRLQTTAFERELNDDKIINALKAINVPVLEDVTFPSIYTDEDGNPVTTNHKAIVGYLNEKRMRQIVTKKSRYNLDINTRNPSSGLIVGNGKGVESDRELESLTLQNMDNTIKELTRSRADDMEAKNQLYNQINTTGMVSLKDIQSPDSAQVARSTVDAYLIGSGIMSNLLETDYMTPYTAENKKKRIEK